MAGQSHIVTVWTMPVDCGLSPEKLASWRAVLSADEVARAEGSYTTMARQSAIAAHALLRGLLQAIDGRSATDWKFALTCTGKPEPVGPSDRWIPHCSLTHTEKLVACAASEQFPVGIDAELRGRPVSWALVTAALAPIEIDLLDSLPAVRRSETFLRLWTLREAYVKAANQNLHFPSETFFFKLDPPRIVFDDGSAGTESDKWRFHAWGAEQHLLSLAVRCRHDAPLTVIKRVVTPDELTFVLDRDDEN